MGGRRGGPVESKARWSWSADLAVANEEEEEEEEEEDAEHAASRRLPARNANMVAAARRTGGWLFALLLSVSDWREEGGSNTQRPLL